MDIEAESAVKVYLQVPKQYNCAQSVAKAFGQDDLLETLQSCGGGKAPGGMCGALYAAMLLLPEEKQEAARQSFQERVGHTLCKPIRQENQTKCVDCVRIAAECLSKARD